MNRHRTVSVSLLAALVVASAVTFRAPEALAQRRIVEDTTPVKSQQRAPRTITRAAGPVAAARQATNGVLVVLTDPPAATVTIDGRVAGKSDAQGQFTRELRGGKQY